MNVNPKDRNASKRFCQSINKQKYNQEMMEDDLNVSDSDLEAENKQLKEALETLQKKYEASEAENKTLLRKIVKLLEEKVQRLEQDLRFFENN